MRRLQSRHGLEVDGVVGPSTWAVLGIKDEPTLTPPASALVDQSSGSSSSTGGGGEESGVVGRVIAAGDEIATRPYVWGGGHGSFQAYGDDCSGSVSYALHGGGLLSSPEDSGELESYGEPGPGKYITIYANAEHAYMVIDGKRFDTVALSESGSRWSSSLGDDGGGFVARHPTGSRTAHKTRPHLRPPQRGGRSASCPRRDAHRMRLMGGGSHSPPRIGSPG